MSSLTFRSHRSAAGRIRASPPTPSQGLLWSIVPGTTNVESPRILTKKTGQIPKEQGQIPLMSLPNKSTVCFSGRESRNVTFPPGLCPKYAEDCIPWQPWPGCKTRLIRILGQGGSFSAAPSSRGGARVYYFDIKVVFAF